MVSSIYNPHSCGNDKMAMGYLSDNGKRILLNDIEETIDLGTFGNDKSEYRHLMDELETNDELETELYDFDGNFQDKFAQEEKNEEEIENILHEDDLYNTIVNFDQADYKNKIEITEDSGLLQTESFFPELFNDSDDEEPGDGIDDEDFDEESEDEPIELDVGVIEVEDKTNPESDEKIKALMD